MQGIVRIGNAGGFWGDRVDAAPELVRQQPDLDYLTIDYLAEVSMSILARQRERDASRGYAADFLETVKLIAPALRPKQQDSHRRDDGAPGFHRLETGVTPRVRVITNAGGLNPRGCAEACRDILREAGCRGLRIAIVTGDDVLEMVRARANERGRERELLRNLETGESIDTVASRLVTANAYLGADALMEALKGGADLVITGRVADPSLTVAACMAHFGWAGDDYERLAGATVAGHLIECGTQVTGGISTDWLDLPDPAHIGFPVVEVSDDGSLVITKPAGTGGRVTTATVKEQLVYEIGDPGRYLSPDATVSFCSVTAEQVGPDRVRVNGAKGTAPPATYKVSATYRAGYRASGMLVVFGRDALAKARRCADIVRQRLRERAMEPQGWLVECLGSGDAVPGATAVSAVLPGGAPLTEQWHTADRLEPGSTLEVVLRISAADERQEVLEQFSKELMPLVTAGPQGITGYAEGRPRVHEVFGYWPCLIERSAVQPRWEMLEVAA